MSNDCTQGSPVQFLVIWDDDLPEGIATTEDQVASFLPPKEETSFLEGLGAVSSGKPRQLAHTATTSTSNRSSGTGNPSSCNTVM